ncbi:MAG: hypothetical protein HY590_05435 [Candidatus Omnitrophica bacterium]|nr:hypothetical protein [Candidatus Omnitrophota bacterium]
MIRRRRPKKEEPVAPSPEKHASSEKPSSSPEKPLQGTSPFENLERVFSSGLGREKTSYLLAKANRLLRFGFGALFCFFLLILFWEHFSKRTNAIPLRVSGETQSTTPTAPSQESPRKPFAYYGEDIEKRDIFRPSFQVAKDIVGGTETLKESVQDLNLLGIVTGKNPQAIIEDKKGGKTHFVNKGDTIGALRVEEIQEERVILNYQGEQLDLTL